MDMCDPLSNRSQREVKGSSTSRFTRIVGAVPQGSVLGLPCLLFTYMNLTQLSLF